MQRSGTRTIVMVIGCGLLLLIGFLVYYLNQTPPASLSGPTTGPTTAILTVQMQQGKTAMGPGSGVWITKYDPETGQTVARYRAQAYTPRPDGRVEVVKPEAEFFSRKNGQTVRVRGDSGVFTAEPSLTSSNRMGDKQSMQQTPSRGELHDVTIVVSQPDHPEVAAFTLTLNNAAFDNDEYSINSESYVDPVTQQRVAAEDVPVLGVGVDYDFSGRGLKLQWNDRDRRLQRLEISHGTQVVIKHPGKSNLIPPTPHEMPTPSPAPPLAPASAPAVAAAAPATQPPGPPVYRATFLDDVHVTQADAELVSAQRMLVDFIMRSDTGATTRPTAALPTSEPAVAAAPEAAPAPSTGPAPEAPIVVHWTGSLVVEPRPDVVAEDLPLVTFVGAPVVASHDQARISCAKLTYHVHDAVLAAQDAPGTKLVLTHHDARGLATIGAQTLTYERRTHVAVLTGVGYADLPAAPDAHAEAQPLRAAWTERCTVQFAGDEESQLAMRHADLEGDVDIVHPQLKLQAQNLTMNFQAALPAQAQHAAPENTLHDLHAAGGVHCDMIDHAQIQTVDCDALQVTMAPSAEGRLLPHNVWADGRVHTIDPQRQLWAAHLAMTLSAAPHTGAAPGATQAVQLETLDARQDVRVEMKDGALAQGDTLALRRVGGHQTARLTGLPEVAAHIAQAGSSLDGPVIDAWPDDQRVVVSGAGRMHGVQQASAKAGVSKPRTVDVAWANSASYDGQSNLVQAAGNVTARSVDPADDSVQTASGHSMTMHLVSAPTTAPSTKSGMFAGKVFHDVTFSDEAEAQSLLAREDGSILKRQVLQAATITYAATDPAGQRRLSVPVPGRMLVEDHRRPATQPVAAAATAAEPSSQRGATAIAWSSSMSYDEAAHLMEMRGDEKHPVIVAHHDDGAAGPPSRLSAQNVWADLEPTPGAGARAQVRLLHARGGVSFSSADDRLTCDALTFDPTVHLITARGSDAASALFTQQGPADKAPQVISAEELQWNTAEDLPRAINADVQLRR